MLVRQSVTTDEALAMTRANHHAMRQEAALALDLRRLARARGQGAPVPGLLLNGEHAAVPSPPTSNETARYYLIKRATDQASALMILKTRTCACVRKSFAGVRWLEGGEERRLTWAEVDGA